MKIKENAVASFVILAVVYVLATVVGAVVYLVLPLDWWLSLLVADVVATVVTFVFSLIFKNASVYDPYWSVQPPVILTLFAVKYGLNVTGILLLVAVWYWGIRLTANWAYTFGNLTHQDWRYTMLAEKTGKAYILVNFVGIHLVPTLVVYACLLPAAYVIYSSAPFSVGTAIFATLAVLVATTQGVADVQMHKFRKAKKEGKASGFIRVGLWKYSRHPNYLCEICMWWCIGLGLVCAVPEMWYLLVGALANTLLFVCVSIPLADGRNSKKEGFAEYKRNTRVLLPIYKKQK